MLVDSDLELVWSLFRHLFPEFSFNHIRVYRVLWRIEPLSGEQVLSQCKLARATTYKLLHELVEAGLVKKTPASLLLRRRPPKSILRSTASVGFKTKERKRQAQKTG